MIFIKFTTTDFEILIKFLPYIRITVTDNGTESASLTEAQRSGRGIGIENTRKRLEALCGGSLKVTAGDGGTKAVILIPAERGKKP